MSTSSTRSKSRVAKLFRNNRSQAVRIPVEFELPGERVLIHREGEKLVIEPATWPTDIVELLAKWRQEAPLGPRDELPEVADAPVRPERIF